LKELLETKFEKANLSSDSIDSKALHDAIVRLKSGKQPRAKQLRGVDLKLLLNMEKVQKQVDSKTAQIEWNQVGSISSVDCRARDFSI
jgi:hypothetical protein